MDKQQLAAELGVKPEALEGFILGLSIYVNKGYTLEQAIAKLLALWQSLLETVSRNLPLENPAVEVLGTGQSVLVTSHRRESWGAPMARTANAIARLAKEFPEVAFLLPAHLNPVVREVLLPPLQGISNVTITEPLSYADFARAMDLSSILLTDSGGVQEEAPSLGKPVLVLRETTERPEAVEAGTVRLVGTDEDLVVAEVTTLLTDPDSLVVNVTQQQSVEQLEAELAEAEADAGIVHEEGEAEGAAAEGAAAEGAPAEGAQDDAPAEGDSAGPPRSAELRG